MDKSTEINKKSFFKYVFKHWILVLSISVVIAIVSTLGTYFWLESTKDERLADIEEKIEVFNEEYEAYYVKELSLESELALLYQDLESQKDYFDKSLYMTMDSWYAKAYTNNFTFSQKASVQGEPTLEKNKFISLVDADMLDNLTGIGRILSVEDEWAIELVKLYYDSNSDIYSLRVLYPDESKAKEIADYVYNVILWMKTRYDRYDEYDIVRDELHATTILDDEIAKGKNDMINKYKDLYRQTEAKKTEIDNFKEPDFPSIKSLSKKNEAVKAVALGTVSFILVWLIYMGICYLRMLNKGIMMTVNDFWSVSGCYPIGKFLSKDKADDEYERLFTIIKMKLKDEKKIMFVGDIESDNMDELVAKAKKQLSKNTITFGYDVKKDTEALKNLVDADVVIPVMEREHTSKKSVIKQSKTINDLDKKIFGCVVF